MTWHVRRRHRACERMSICVGVRRATGRVVCAWNRVGCHEKRAETEQLHWIWLLITTWADPPPSPSEPYTSFDAQRRERASVEPEQHPMSETLTDSIKRTAVDDR